MPPRKLSLIARPEHQGKRLDHVLAEWLPQALGQVVSRGKVRKLVVAGAVYLNGKRIRIASRELRPGSRIEVYVDAEKLFQDESAQDRPFEMTGAYILYEDEYLIAVNKPPGLPTQPTLDEARQNLFAALKKFMANRERDPQAYIGLHHRLDRDTSGVVLFTKRKEANLGVSELFTKHLARKTYHALCARPSRMPPGEWTVKNHLGKATGTGKRARFTAVKSGGDFAHTDFRLLETLAEGLWVEAKPRTGRTHQIRVHLAEEGLPILGDATYGPRDQRAATRADPGAAPRLMLHAANLTFPHPVTNLEISITSPTPEDFAECLKRLRQKS